MFRFSAKTRLSFGLVSLQSSLLLMVSLLGLIPDPLAITLRERTKLCEAIALNSSILLSQKDHDRVGTTLRALVQRNPDLLSAAIRTVDDKLELEVGDHAANWEPIGQNRSVETQVQVPLFAGSERWGQMELRFAPLYSAGWRGALELPLVRLLVVLSLLSVVAYWLYLRKTLQLLDPSQAVPDRVRSALDALAEGLLVLDHKGRIALANQSFSDIVKQPADSLLGVVASSLPWLNEQNADCKGPFAWETVQKEGQSVSKQILKMTSTDGGTLTLAANAAPVLGQDGRCRGSLVSFDDVTVLETQKVELRQSKVAAEAANEAKTSFLANMSHEIRTPMNAILGYTDILRRGLARSEAERDQHLSIIYTSGEHLLNLINDILDLSKIEAGRLEIERTDCQPYRIMREVVAVLQVRAKEKGIQLQTVVTGAIPETIQSDPTRLRQVLMNLVGNAVKFTEHGAVTLRARVVSDWNTSLLEIDVQDTGVGIAPEAMKKIFDPFTQADHTVTRRYGGTGLGLTISRRLAENLGGTLTVRSEPGKGSTFTLSVALGSLSGVRMLTEPELNIGLSDEITPASTSNVLPTFSRGRVLIADDVVANRQLVCLMLRRAGLEVIEAENGQIAVELATQQSFDVILMDMQMPVMDGYTATRMLRSKRQTLPIVAFTGSIMQAETDECFQAGCTDFLAKPVKLETLFALLAKYLPTCGVLEPASAIRASEPVAASSADESSAEDDPHQILELIDQMKNDLSRRHAAEGEPELDTASAELPKLLRCSLPLNDPEILSAVTRYVVKLRLQVQAMRSACQRQEFGELAQLAHWLKGSGGTLGFDAFTAPAKSLEQAAKTGDVQQVEELLHRIATLVTSIELPSTMLNSSADSVQHGGQRPILDLVVNKVPGTSKDAPMFSVER